jgi:baculoviral IAP repeat-containing protein 6
MKTPVTTLSLKPKMLNTKIACGLNLVNEDGEKVLILVVYNIEDSTNSKRNSTSTNTEKALAPIQLNTIDEKLEDYFNTLIPSNEVPENNLIPAEQLDELFLSNALVGSTYKSITNFSPPPATSNVKLHGSSNHPDCTIACVPVQYNEIVPNIPHNCEITDIIPSSDNKLLLVVLRKAANGPAGQGVDEEVEDNRVVFLLFSLDENGLLKSEAPIKSFLGENETPVEIQMLPKCDSSGRNFGGPETENGVFMMTCLDGTIKIVSLKTLEIISVVSVKDDRFVSASYCNGISGMPLVTSKN